MSRSPRGTLRERVSRGVALALCIVGVACTGGADYRATLEVRDGWVRAPGTECAGSRPFLYVHRDAPFQVERGSSGEVIASGELPAGRAVEALRQELGVPRVPTFCRFRFDLSLPGPGSYRFVVEGGEPVGFEAAAGSTAVTVIIP